MLCTLVFRLLISENSGGPRLFMVLQGEQAAHWSREGQGIPLHDGEEMKHCVTISASLK